jgi:hypothetical protein
MKLAILEQLLDAIAPVLEPFQGIIAMGELLLHLLFAP